MPNGGSVNQIEPSDLHTMSFGEFSGLPSYLSATVVIVPSYSVREMRRVPCSQVSKPALAVARVAVGEIRRLAETVAPLSSSQRMMRLFGCRSRAHSARRRTTPALRPGKPVASRSTFARFSR